MLGYTFKVILRICGYGGIGRRARFRFWWETVQVQVLLPALNGANLNPLYFFKKVFAVVVKFAKRE